MRKLLLILMTFSFSFLYSQNRLEMNMGYGYYLYNSENTIKIMGDEKFSSYLFYGFAYQKKNIFGINFRFEYNYHKTLKENTISFLTSRCDGCTLRSFGGDVSLTNHTFDFDYVLEIGNTFSLGIGPSSIITNKTIYIEGIQPQHKTPILYDKLASSSLGVNGFLDIQIPFSEDKNYFHFTSRFRFRYTYSIWFDEGIRNLDNYHQEYFITQLSMGVGYCFF